MNNTINQILHKIKIGQSVKMQDDIHRVRIPIPKDCVITELVDEINATKGLSGHLFTKDHNTLTFMVKVAA